MQYKIGKNIDETFVRHGHRNSSAVQLNSGPVSKNRTTDECLLWINSKQGSIIRHKLCSFPSKLRTYVCSTCRHNIDFALEIWLFCVSHELFLLSCAGSKKFTET